MLLALAVIALAAAGVAIAYFLTHRDDTTNVTTVVTSSGTTTAARTMPKLTGTRLAQAKTTLSHFGITPSVTPETSKKPAGTVLAQAPAAGAALTDTTGVTLVVAQAKEQATTTTSTSTSQTTTSAGATTTAPTTTAPPPAPRTVTVPDLSGKTEVEAVQALGRAGILASLAFVPSSDPLGTVEGQAKSAGTSVPYHSHMQVNLSTGPGDKPREQVPSVIGKTLQEGLAAINGAHLRLLYLRFPVTSRSQAGKIVQQSPLGGAQAPRNAQVVVYLGAFSG
jgi:beta-lactam-binding protein with PASTA domain